MRRLVAIEAVEEQSELAGDIRDRRHLATNLRVSAKNRGTVALPRVSHHLRMDKVAGAEGFERLPRLLKFTRPLPVPTP